MPVPAGIGLLEAAALPEVACTVWSNVVVDAGLAAGDVLLVHGGAGGIGTFAIQAGVALGARVAVTAGSPEKLARCRELGAEILVDYSAQDFVESVRRATDGHGADVVLDNMGAAYLGRNIDVLAVGGRLQVIGLQGGAKGELDLGRLMAKRASVRGTTLRARPVAEKSAICARVVPMSDAAEAHRVMAASEHVGKVLLAV
jgi:NADPH:quinone reductase-like Zn-dependent oxidoreductase